MIHILYVSIAKKNLFDYSLRLLFFLPNHQWILHVHTTYLKRKALCSSLSSVQYVLISSLLQLTWIERAKMVLNYHLSTHSLRIHLQVNQTLSFNVNFYDRWGYLANQYPIILQSVSRLFQLHQEERDGWRDWIQREILLSLMSGLKGLKILMNLAAVLLGCKLSRRWIITKSKNSYREDEGQTG